MVTFIYISISIKEYRNIGLTVTANTTVASLGAGRSYKRRSLASRRGTEEKWCIFRSSLVSNLGKNGWGFVVLALLALNLGDGGVLCGNVTDAIYIF